MDRASNDPWLYNGLSLVIKDPDTSVLCRGGEHSDAILHYLLKVELLMGQGYGPAFKAGHL